MRRASMRFPKLMALAMGLAFGLPAPALTAGSDDAEPPQAGQQADPERQASGRGEGGARAEDATGQGRGEGQAGRRDGDAAGRGGEGRAEGRGAGDGQAEGRGAGQGRGD